LVPLATLVTPNLDEAGILVGEPVRTLDAMERAGRALIELGAKAALVKGGHLPGDEVVDLLVVDGAVRRFARPRLDTTSTHGTGCTLSAAIAAGLAHGRPLERAVADGLDFVARALAAAPGPRRASRRRARAGPRTRLPREGSWRPARPRGRSCASRRRRGRSCRESARHPTPPVR